MVNLAFLASHNGSNVRAILEDIKSLKLEGYSPELIITNNPDAGVIKVARGFNVDVHCFNSKNCPDSLDETILVALNHHRIDLVLLAGYMRPLGKTIMENFPNRILNIHPALLPKYGGKGMYGLNVHKAVIDSSDSESGATVHLVTENYDEGRILSQCKVPIYRPNDTPETLQERVLAFEHVLYSQTLRDIQKGIIILDE